jgi:hypothetical protein
MLNLNQILGILKFRTEEKNASGIFFDQSDFLMFLANLINGIFILNVRYFWKCKETKISMKNKVIQVSIF